MSRKPRNCTVEGCDRHAEPGSRTVRCLLHLQLAVPPNPAKLAAAYAPPTSCTWTRPDGTRCQLPYDHPQRCSFPGETPTLPQARQQRDQALAQVDAAADEEWRAAARAALAWCAANLPTFSTDDVWGRLADVQAPAPREPRALGPLVMAAVRTGRIKDTGSMTQSRRRHASRIPLYRAGA